METTGNNIPMKGMNRDDHPSRMDEKGMAYSFMLNGTYTGTDGDGFPICQNEPSNLLSVELPAGFKVIGLRYINELRRALYLLHNANTGESQIGQVKDTPFCADRLLNDDELVNCSNCDGPSISDSAGLETKIQQPCAVYEKLAFGNCLGLHEDFPIVSISYKLMDCHLGLYWADAKNPRRYIYFKVENRDILTLPDDFKVVNSYVQQNNCQVPVYGTAIDCATLHVNAVISGVNVTVDKVLESGGELKEGSYSFAVSYCNKNGETITPFSGYTAEVPLFERSFKEAIGDIYVTAHAIKLRVQGLRKTGLYTHYNIAVVSTLSGTKTFQQLGPYELTEEYVTITGRESTGSRTASGGTTDSNRAMAPGELYVLPEYFSTAEHSANTADYLFWAGLTEFPKLNLQRVANGIKVYWKTTEMPGAAFADPLFNNKYKGYMRDEVYALGVQFEFDDRVDLTTYHIPGRAPTQFDLDIVSGADVINDVDTCPGNDLRNRRWQVYNTASVISSLRQPFDECKETCHQYGVFSYWQSSENYPNNQEVWGDLACSPIRHHKFPDSSITHIHDSKDGIKGFNDRSNIYALGILIDHDSVRDSLNKMVTEGVIDADQRSHIVGYRILRGDRIGNNSIIAKGLLYDMWSYDVEKRKWFYANYPFNSLQPDNLISPSRETYSPALVDTMPDKSKMAKHRNVFVPTGRYTIHSPDYHYHVHRSRGDELKIESLEYGEAEIAVPEVLDHPRHRFLTFFANSMAFVQGMAAGITAVEGKVCTVMRWKNAAEHDSVNIQPQTRDWRHALSLENLIGNRVALKGIYEGKGKVTRALNFVKWLAKTILGSGTGGVLGPAFTAVTTAITTAADIAIDTAKKAGILGALEGATVKPAGVTEEGFDEVNNPTEHETHLCSGDKEVMKAFPGLLVGATSTILGRIGMGMVEAAKSQAAMTLLLKRRNFARFFTGVGIYNNYKVPVTGQVRRKLENWSWLDPDFKVLKSHRDSSASEDTYVNNWGRESAVYLKIPQSFAAPSVVDNSRFFISESSALEKKFKDEPNAREYRTVSSYYGAVKQYIPDQYGDITSIRYVGAGSRYFNLQSIYPMGACSATVWGGDVTITRMALKRKLPFFRQTAFNGADDVDFDYTDYPNVGYPNFYFKTSEPLGERMEGIKALDLVTKPLNFFKALTGTPANRLDLDRTSIMGQRGYIYLYSYGIPYFYTESVINNHYRYALAGAERDFYPRRADYDQWTQEKEVSILSDNVFATDSGYTTNTVPGPVTIQRHDFKPSEECNVVKYGKVVYSEEHEPLLNIEEKGDKWLIYKPANSYVFPQINGKIISVEGIENSKVLVRFTDTMQIFNAHSVLQADSQTIVIGNGGLFVNKPQEFFRTELGYGGSQHRAMLHTEFGHVFVDAERGQVFMLGTGGGKLELLTGRESNMYTWFMRNLPFNLKRDFPNLPQRMIDNPYGKAGISLAYDRIGQRILLTKRDYIKKSNLVKYDTDLGIFYVETDLDGKVEVSYTDTQFFDNASWTIGYSLAGKSWLSYYSFIPDFYISKISGFESGLNNRIGSGKATVWDHLSTDKSFQVYYGKLYPFKIAMPLPHNYNMNYLRSVEYRMDTVRFYKNSRSYRDDITFNKAFIYSDFQCTGELVLERKQRNNLSKIYPISAPSFTRIEVDRVNGSWRFNQFADLSKKRGVPVIQYGLADTDIQVNHSNIKYIGPAIQRNSMVSDQHMLMLINDKYSNFKFIVRTVKTERHLAYK